MKLQIETPAHLIDVNGIGLDKIEPTAEAMRAPGEAPGMMALEIAMDETPRGRQKLRFQAALRAGTIRIRWGFACINPLTSSMT